ncbi:MAG: ABC transporter permease [Anaerolineae bacterium]|nr:ABC transporter permease [Anaerolineae bacterium]
MANAVSSEPSRQDVGNNSLEKLKNFVLDFIINYGMIVAILATLVYFTTQTESFFTAQNLLLIVRSSSWLIIVSIGITLTVAVGGFDVSVGSVASLASMLSVALMVIWEWPWQTAVLAALAVGAAIGLVNSFLIIQLKIPDLLATLGMLYFADGLHRVITQGEAAANGMANPWADRTPTEGRIAETFLELGSGRFWGGTVPQWLIDVMPENFFIRGSLFQGFPYAVVLVLVVAVVFHVFLQYTRWGRMFYAVGSNREAARLSGIPVNRVRLSAYVLSGILAAIAGIVIASFTGRGSIGAGADTLLDGVAATFFGFAVLGARRPNVFGTVLGALYVQALLIGLTQMGISDFYQDVIKGTVLLASLSLSFYLFRGRS